MREPTQDGSSIGISETDLNTALKAARTGDEMAFAILWRHLNPRLTRFVQARTYKSSIDFEEVISETWVGVARDIRKFKGNYIEFTAWIYQISRNRIVDAARKRDRTVRTTEEIEEIFWLPDVQNVERDFEAGEGVKGIIDLINKLPSAQAEVLLLRVVSDLSVEETAKILKKSANSVRVLAYRGLETLRADLGSANA